MFRWRRISKNVLIIFFVELTMKCMFKKKKSTLFFFDDKRCYKKNIKNIAWK